MALQVQERDSVFYVVGRLMGRRVNKSTGLPALPKNRRRAEGYLARIERDILADGPILRGRLRRVSTAVDDHIKVKDLVERDTGYRTLMEFRAKFGSRQISTVTSQEVQDWVHEKWRPGGSWSWKGSSLRRELSPIVTLFKREWEAGNRDRPLKLTLPKGGGERAVYLFEHQAKRVIDMDRSCALFPLFTLLLTTGGRFHEIARLDWSNVDLIRSQIVLGTYKGESGDEEELRQRVVPLLPSTHDALTSLGYREGAVIRNSRGAALGSNGIQTAWYWWKKIRDEIGRPDVTIHDLRHTYASLLVMKGVPLKTVSDLLGHTNINRTNKYAHLRPSTLHGQVSVLGL